MMEINFVRNEVVHSLNHVRDWMKPERVFYRSFNLFILLYNFIFQGNK